MVPRWRWVDYRYRKGVPKRKRRVRFATEGESESLRWHRDVVGEGKTWVAVWSSVEPTEFLVDGEVFVPPERRVVLSGLDVVHRAPHARRGNAPTLAAHGGLKTLPQNRFSGLTARSAPC